MKSLVFVAAVVVTGAVSTVGLRVPSDATNPVEGSSPVLQTVQVNADSPVSMLLNSVSGADGVSCSLLVRGLSNSWGRYSGMVTISDGDITPLERDVLNWSSARSVDQESAGELARGLSSSDVCVRRVASSMFTRVEGELALRTLRPLVDSGALVGRVAAIRALGYAESREAVGVLSSALVAQEPVLRRAAAWAMGEIGSKEGVADLIRALEDQDAGVRRNAAWALGEIESPESVPALSRAAETDQESSVRSNSAWALGRIEHADAIPVLTRVLGADRDAGVRRVAAWALGQMS